MYIDTIFKLIIIVAAFGGFLIAFYMRCHKAREDSLVCPLGYSCKDVIRSKYAKLFGVEVTTWGILYYGLIIATYITFLAQNSLHEMVQMVVLGISTFAVLFSAYLTGVQAFLLKEWCTWCLFSAGLSTIIVIFSYLILF